MYNSTRKEMEDLTDYMSVRNSQEKKVGMIK